MPLPFEDRKQAGELLGALVKKRLRGAKAVVVLGIPRGGVETAFYVAKALGAPLGVVVAKKLAHPLSNEMAIGAVSHAKTVVVDENLAALGVPQDHVEREVQRVARLVDEKFKRLSLSGKLPDVRGKTAVVVDDGLATGHTMRAALEAARKLGAAKVVAAAPVAPPETVQGLASRADDVVVLETPALFTAIGQFYKRFPQVADDEARAFLARAKSF